MKRMNTRNSGPYLICATRRQVFPLILKTTRLSATKSAAPNIARTWAGLVQAAFSTIENQSRRGCSASGCFLQNSTSVFRLKIRNSATLARSQFGSTRFACARLRGSPNVLAFCRTEHK